MTIQTSAPLPKNYSRTAGLIYLAIAVVAGFSIAYVPSVIVAAGDAGTTAANLLGNQGLFRLGILGDVTLILLEIVLSVMLFVVFKATSPTVSMIAMVSRLLMVVVMAINVIIGVMPFVLLDVSTHLGAFTPEQVQAMALTLIEARGYGVYVWDVFFGLNVLVLGWLCIKSGFLPKLLGIVLMIGSAGYFLEGLRHVTFVDSPVLAMAVPALIGVAALGELAFAFWLMIKSPNGTIVAKGAQQNATGGHIAAVA
jgi:hypothetical protein